MTELQFLTELGQLIDNLKQTLQENENNYNNEEFNFQPNEDMNDEYNRGEGLFQNKLQIIEKLQKIVNNKRKINKLFLSHNHVEIFLSKVNQTIFRFFVSKLGKNISICINMILGR